MIDKFKTLNLSDKKIIPLINGKDLIDLGNKPGPEFKELLNKCYDYQIDNNIDKKEEVYCHLLSILNNERELNV